MSQTPEETIPAEQSILASTKKILGIPDGHTEFDLDVILHINSAFSNLSQLGIGPASGFMIADRSTRWVDYLHDDLLLNSVKTYIYLKLRMWFDPPATSYHLTALEHQVEQLEWRLNIARESTEYVAPESDLEPPVSEVLILDGGTD